MISEYARPLLLTGIKTKRWKKKTDFYSLFLYLASHKNFLPLNYDMRSKIRLALDEFETTINRYLSSDSETTFGEDSTNYGKSVIASSDLGNRKRRHISLSNLLDPIFGVGINGHGKTEVTPLQEGLFDITDSEDEA